LHLLYFTATHCRIIIMASKSTRCVSFDLSPNYWYIEQLDDIDDDMFYDLWFDEDEIKAMQASAARVMSGNNKDDSPRGLEYHTFEGGERRRYERSKVSEAVLGEQLRQRAARDCEGTPVDPERIAVEYRKVSKHHQDLAYQRGTQDAADASGNPIRSGLTKLYGSARNLFGSSRNLVDPIS